MISTKEVKVDKEYSEDSCSDNSSSMSMDDDQMRPRVRQRGTLNEATLRQSLGRQETMVVCGLRLVVLVILLTATAVVSALAYVFSHRNEVQAFQNAYVRQSTLIIDTVQVNAQHKLEAMAAIAMEIQAHAVTSQSTWPFVTVPFFEERIITSKSLTEAYGVYFFPIVSPDLKEEWERYSVEHRFWIDDSYAAQRAVYGIDGCACTNNSEPGSLNASTVDWFDMVWSDEDRNDHNPDFSLGISSKIFKTRNYLNASDHSPTIDDDPIHNASITAYPTDYFPQWQAAPLSWYYQLSANLDYGHYEDFLDQTVIIRRTETAAFGQAWTDSHTPGFLSTVLYPIFDKFYPDPISNVAPKVTAFLGVDVLWQDFLKGILAPNSDQLFVVINNTCNQTFTYRLNGPTVEFVGEGDLHNTKFDDKVLSAQFAEELMQRSENSSSTYTGRLLYGEYCPYTFTVSPTQQMQENYVTNRPVIYSVAACLIFIFTSAIFVVYDLVVERRQRLVMNSAARSDAVVASLFPKEVKDRLYEEREQQERTAQSKAMKETWKGNEAECLTPISNIDKNDSTMVSPIASLYPETTIMFADLVGFTAWSSNRQPSDVFLLLETIYGVFDKIAKRRDVFKVETIGDCYVAVTGIPRPQARHALIMTKFAQECQMRLIVELQRLAETHLGKETMSLAMRVGLHSGPVTAGVLRGAKARFQLFGDTMNTAARMEHNGQPNRIHVSETTAKLLIESKKGHWVIQREDKVVAKGKGEMQTYWVASKTAGSIFSSYNHDSLVNSFSRIQDLDDLTSRPDGLEDFEEEEDCDENTKGQEDFEHRVCQTSEIISPRSVRENLSDVSDLDDPRFITI